MTKSIAIIGAGLAGLTCAKTLLESQENKITIYDQNPEVGGRVYSSNIEGYTLDHGFQVYLPGYPIAAKILNHQKLELKEFTPGANIYKDQKFFYVGDPIREPSSFFSTLMAPIGSFKDKISILKLKIASKPSMKLSTYDYLIELGFSTEIIENFFRPFFSGVFLERELMTPAHFFHFLFHIFSKSPACLPAKGMHQLPLSIKEELPSVLFKLNHKVESFNSTSVDGEEFDIVVKAYADKSNDFNPVTTDYFVSNLKLKQPSLYLKGRKSGLINHIAPLSVVAPEYKGSNSEELFSVNLLKENYDADVSIVQKELSTWFPGSSFRHLKRYNVTKALPTSPAYGKDQIYKDGFYHCGDHMEDPSINGAIASGIRTAGEILKA
ncbi:MAG: FAD-dependent oxidoreductase [Bacteriovoracaceae bacterium]